ncbi:MAG: hypothetical protein CFE43_13325 [Burkholderiales bacterium PBB3]|nr:MAG: hypothetical protein CFE43_13325 [Burkholderiales bacterium PBB3]
MTHIEVIPQTQSATTADLTVALADARTLLHDCAPPPRVQVALHKSLGLPLPSLSAVRASPWQQAVDWLVRQRWSAAVVALVLVCVVAGVAELGMPPGRPPMRHAMDDLVGGGFMPVGNPAGLANGATAWLVSTEMSRQQLITLGLPFDPARAADTVPAEVLLRPNGELLAVRLMP